ncbi:TPA: response regulator transcription factor [Candidatus Bipolaricaulota bacterium]|nr:response regulator transcription factor [Candidatus Bipolaricaulota bacterium]
MIRVLIVDDHPLVRRGLARLLSRAGMEPVGEAANGEEGLRLARELEPDVVLWDLAMPGGGLGALEGLRGAAPGARVLVLTALDDPLLAREAARAGATGFLAKTCPPEELIAAVRACARGTHYFPRLPCLSPREEEVLAFLSQGLSNREIAARLGVSVKTVESHLEKLKGKLGCASTAELRARALRRPG